MDIEELICKFKAITVRKEDKNKVMLEVWMETKSKKVLVGCLVGKVLLTRGVNKEGLKIALQQVWRTFWEVKIESLGNNIFMFKFAEKVDKRRVIAEGPWHFDKVIIVLTKQKEFGRPQNNLLLTHLSRYRFVMY